MSNLNPVNKLLLNIKNIPGPGTRRKILVLECDDWGSIRMPNKEIHTVLIKNGLIHSDDKYSNNDTLADKTDLELLFEVLLGVRDSHDQPAVMTPITNVANPDFEKIKESGFKQYFLEPFTNTLKRYNRDPETFNTWKKGMDLGIFIPESHGREHISVQFWLNELQKGNSRLLEAFEYGVISVPLEGINPIISGFRPEFYFNSEQQTEFLINSITDGISMFKQIFGYIPRAFVPSNNIFHPVFEHAVADAGVRYLFVSHLSPVPDKRGNLKLKYYRTGKKTSGGLIYYTRNCAFEPTDPGYPGIGLTLRQIEAAFRWGKPANISTHRVNFIGALNEKNRDKGLKELRSLLKAIVLRWPDVEFMCSADMFKALYEKN
jgi:hypothetical protein